MTTNWTWPPNCTSPEDRARAVATSYRHALERLDTDDARAALAELDQHWTGAGAGWIVPTQVPLREDDWLTAREIADLFHRTVQWPHWLAKQGHIEVRYTNGKPRFRVGDLLAHERRKRVKSRPS
jgi:hypothetical protein